MRFDVLQVVSEVAKSRGVALDSLLGRKRTKSIAMARKHAMWSVRKRLGLSYPELGIEFERDHTTCISAVRSFELELVNPRSNSAGNRARLRRFCEGSVNNICVMSCAGGDQRGEMVREESDGKSTRGMRECAA